MAKYRKKPVEIEAVQLFWHTWNDVCDFVSKEAFGGGVYLDENFQEVENTAAPHFDTAAPHIGLKIKTLEGIMLAKEGDYIIKGVQGEFYPCKPDIFEKTYDKV